MFVDGPHGPVQGIRDVEGDDTVVFIFGDPLSGTDSTDDGIYTVTIEVCDELGCGTDIINVEVDPSYVIFSM